MKTTVYFCLGAALLAAAWIFGFRMGSGPSPALSRDPGLDAEVGAIRSEMAALAAENRELRSSLEGLKSERQPLAPAPTAASPAAGPVAADASPPPASGEDAALAEALETLSRPGESPQGRQKAWNRIARAGKLDEAVEYFEARAKDNPRSADCQAELGHAYIQKIFTAGDLEKRDLAGKADRAYDRALELDERHWEARYSKAVSYSFWPPVFGMQSRAIEQFEILRGQQEAEAPQKKFADTYLLLGNLYDNQGKGDKAREIWRKGLELFPDQAELSARAQPAEAR